VVASQEKKNGGEGANGKKNSTRNLGMYRCTEPKDGANKCEPEGQMEVAEGAPPLKTPNGVPISQGVRWRHYVKLKNWGKWESKGKPVRIVSVSTGCLGGFY